MKKLCCALFLIITLFALIVPTGCSNKQAQTFNEIDQLIQEGSFERAGELIDSIKGQAGKDKIEALERQLNSAISAESLKKGMLLLEGGDLEEALHSFENVNPDSDSYSEAVKRISEVKELLFESYIEKSREYYLDGKPELAVQTLEKALKIRDSQPVRELIGHYRHSPDPKKEKLSAQDTKEAIEKMRSYEEGTGPLKVSLDNIYSRELQLETGAIKVSGDNVILKLWVNIVNDGEGYWLIKPEYIKLVTGDKREYTYHQDYTGFLDIPFGETQLPPKGRVSGRLVFVIPLENSYKFEYNDGNNIVNKTVIPY